MAVKIIVINIKLIVLRKKSWNVISKTQSNIFEKVRKNNIYPDYRQRKPQVLKISSIFID